MEELEGIKETLFKGLNAYYNKVKENKVFDEYKSKLAEDIKLIEEAKEIIWQHFDLNDDDEGSNKYLDAINRVLYIAEQAERIE